MQQLTKEYNIVPPVGAFSMTYLVEHHWYVDAIQANCEVIDYCDKFDNNCWFQRGREIMLVILTFLQQREDTGFLVKRILDKLKCIRRNAFYLVWREKHNPV